MKATASVVCKVECPPSAGGDIVDVALHDWIAEDLLGAIATAGFWHSHHAFAVRTSVRVDGELIAVLK